MLERMASIWVLFQVLVLGLLVLGGSTDKIQRHGPIPHGKTSMNKQDIMLNGTVLTNLNTRGMGYYYLSFYQSSDCSDSAAYQEGYQTGKCLRLANAKKAGSIRMDCSATLDGVQVQYFSASRTCTGVMTTMVYPVGSSYGSNCYPVLNSYFSQALNLYNAGLVSFSPMCMFVNAQNPGIPVQPLYTLTAVVESMYQSSVGCQADSVFQLPDSWKAFLQTPVMTSYCTIASSTSSSTSTIQRAIAPYNTNSLGQMMCPLTGAIMAFAGNFDGACVVPTAINKTSIITYNKCYGPSTLVGGGVSPMIEGNPNLRILSGTYPSLSTSFSLTGSKNCRDTCLMIYPRCARPTGQPSTQPSSTPSTMVASKTPTTIPTVGPTVKTPSCKPTAMPSTPTYTPTIMPFAPSFKPTAMPFVPSYSPTIPPTVTPTRPTGQPSVQPSTQPTHRPSIHPTMQPSGEPTNQPTCQPTRQPSVQPTSQPTHLPTQQPTTQPSNQPTMRPSTQPTRQPSRQPTTQPTNQPTQQPSEQPTMNPSTQPTRQPSRQPSEQPTSRPSRQPSSQPSRQPSNQPTRQPTLSPSHKPIVYIAQSPTGQPTEQPSRLPSMQPTTQPTQPTGQPTHEPSRQPTEQPTRQPSSRPTHLPTRQPTVQPTRQPSSQPTEQPTRQPSRQPTRVPSRQPTSQPTRQPTHQPTNSPSRQPSSQPSHEPSQQPTRIPSRQPSSQPSSFPTAKPTTWNWKSPPNIGGCNMTTLRACLKCMVAPPGYSLFVAYKQYSCLGQPLSAFPTTAPTSAPTMTPTIAGTTSSLSPVLVTAPVSSPSPTYKAGSVPGASTSVIVQVTQKLSGLDLATAQSPAFQTLFITTVATELSIVPSSNVVIKSVTAMGRRFLLADLSIVYTVQTTNQNPVILAQIIAANEGALTTSLQTTYPTAVVSGTSVANSSPSTTSTSPASSCFAGEEVVMLENGRKKRISDVVIGDRVLAMNDQSKQMVYSDVIYVPHAYNQQTTVFVKITTTSGFDLKMTENHLIPVGTCTKDMASSTSRISIKDTRSSLSSFTSNVFTPKPAQEIVIGDCVETIHGPETVVFIDKIPGQGIYTIIAMERLLIINGIVATPFGGINPTLANAYYNLHRLMYRVGGKSWMMGYQRTLQWTTDNLWNMLTISFDRSLLMG